MITKKHVFEEVMSPKEFEKIEDMKVLYKALYKVGYMAIRLLLDVRVNQQKMAEKQGFKLKDDKPKSKSDNPVIKNSDTVE